jgi:hypothetical protein
MSWEIYAQNNLYIVPYNLVMLKAYKLAI